jgi:hypothetical protein
MRLRTVLSTAAVFVLCCISPRAAAPIACADCNGDGRVTVDELVRGVAIALRQSAADDCPAIDRDGDGAVTVDELVAAVGDALRGCPPVIGPTPTATPAAPATATVTRAQIPPTDAIALIAWLERGAYLDWPAESHPHPSAGPHFGVIRTFVNDALFASLGAAAAQHPAGAAAVKELYGATGDHVRGWAVMVKVQSDSDAGRGWYWYEGFNGSGGGGLGSPGCTGCHASGRDFVRIPFPLQ